ncbi:hypothetical protein KHP62_13445 [Rhodobacteraceae bacterium NNCM2]|nr:hypothetical protein [Coraliihabitans acroporae]
MIEVETGEAAEIAFRDTILSDIATGEDGNALGWDESRAPRLFDRDLPWGRALVDEALAALDETTRAEIEENRVSW